MTREYTNQGRDQFNFEKAGDIHVHNIPTKTRDPLLVKLLNRVKDEVEERSRQRIDRYMMPLGQEDSGSVIDLDKVYVPGQVTQPTRREVRVNAIQQPIDDHTSILEIFQGENVRQKLLILGDPGSGKTTLLLELAQALVQQAEQNEAAAIPVLVNLASWQDPKQSISDWLTGELNSKYGLNKRRGQSFLARNQILPLFDGLDEVTPKLQPGCASAINSWLMEDLEKEPIGAAICCRREEYETTVRQKLFLKNSILLLPLTDTHIQTYLETLQLEPIWPQIQQSSELKKLLERPLFLSIFGFVALQKHFDLGAWNRLNTSQEQIRYLFDGYWDAVMDRPLIDQHLRLSQNQKQQSKTYGAKALPKKKAVKKALIFAAKGMSGQYSKTTKQSELLIEKLQPSWLPHRKQKIIYGLIGGLIYGLIGGLIVGLIVGLIGGLIVGLIVGLIGGLSDSPIETVELIQISMSREARREIFRAIWQNLIYGLIGGLIYGLIGGLIFGLIGGLIYGLIVGLIFGLIGGLIEGCKADLVERISPNQGIKNSIRNLLLLTIPMIAVLILLNGVVTLFFDNFTTDNNITSLWAGISAALIWATFYASGGGALIAHTALRIVLKIYGYAPFRYDKLLDYCTERLLLQRLGGRYRFMHPLLQDYFANMPLD